MNFENNNNIIYEIQQLQKRDFNILLNTETIISDFESLNKAKSAGRNTLPARYRFIKNIQSGLYKSLAYVTESQIKEFVSACRAVEKIRLELSKEYETKKLISGRVRKLKNCIANIENNGDENAIIENAGDESV